MAEPIKTTSGRTPKARIAALRAQREPSTDEKLVIALRELEALAHHIYVDLRAMRDRQNAYRTRVVEALQLVKQLEPKKLDVEL